MKMLMKYTLTIIVFMFTIYSGVTNAQSSNGNSWANKFGYQKSFIENKGQFSIPDAFGNLSPAVYVVDHGGTKIYFTKKGITYTFLEATKKQKNEREMKRELREEYRNLEEHLRREKEEHQLKIKTDQVTMLWENANVNTSIEPSELTSDYHNYYFKQTDGNYKDVSNIKAFKKITYKNLYPNIDVEYIFHEKSGLKYTLILHPGADPSRIKMVYDNHVSLNSNGEIRIDTRFGDIVEHAPLSFYHQNNSSIIKSSFIKSKNKVSFQLENYDNSKTIVIDPWTQTPAFTSNWDCVWECEKDGAGNVYAIGGVMPVQLLKYNAAGTLQWTYNTPYDTTSWIGTFAVDNIGNSYVTNGTTPGIIKVNTSGALQWTVGGGALAEYWNIAFNCDQTKLIVGGTDNLRGAIFDINTINGAVIASKIVAYGSAFGFPPSIQEVRSITSCANGRYYFLTLDSIGYISQNLNLCANNASLFKTTSTHGFSYKCENYRRDNTGIMAIRADANFVYTHNGTTLFKRSLANASIIASVAIPGGAAITSLGQKAVSCSGIDIDAAGNIYVGSTNAVTKFSSALVQLATVAVPFNVYDVHVSNAGDIIACGSTGNSGTASRTGYIQSISSLTASNTLSLTCCDINICQPSTLCSTAFPFNLQAATPGGTWSGTGITNTTLGTFNTTTAGVGSHVISYSIACGVGTTTIVVSPCATLSVCLEPNGSVTVSNGAPTYTWATFTPATSTPITNQSQCQSCGYTWFFGQCLNGVIPVTSCTTAASWTNFATSSNTNLPVGATLIKITDAAGTIITFTPGTIPACSTSTCPTLSLSVTSQTNVNCFGANTGTATINTTGGTGPYSYTWTPGNLTGASQSSLAAGTYTIAVKDVNNCIGTGTLSMTQPVAPLSAVISSTTASSCTLNSGGATVNPSGGTPGYTYGWSPSGGTTAGVSNLGVGNNTVVVTDIKGCTVTAVANITCSNFCNPNGNLAIFSNYDGGILTVNVDQNIPNLKVGICTYEPIQVNFTGPFVANVTQVIYAGFNSNQNNNNCSLGNFPTSITGVPAGIVTINPPLSPPLVGYTPVHNNGAGPWGGQMIGTAGNCDTTINGGGGNTPDEIVYYFQQATAGTLLFHQTQYNCWINQTLNISAGGNCCILPGNTSCPPISLSVLSSSNVSCFGGSNGAATIAGNGSAGPYTYTWIPGNLSSASQTSLSAGTYTINVTDVNQCSGSGTISISQPTTSISALITATTPAGCGGGSSSTIFWTEDFGVGCNQGALASVYTGTNGSWTVTNTGINDASANQWFVSATEAGMGVGNCGDGCLGSFTNNRTLHISNVSTSPAAFIFCPAGDCGAAYDTGIGFNNVTADKRAESPQINCSGKSNITLNFNYIEGGATTIDDATLWYFDGAIWNQIDNMPKTIVCGSGQGQWASRNIVLPASANNNPNIKIGFRWLNNDDGAGTDPSFAVDDISLTASSTNGASGGATVTVSGGTPSYTYSWIPSGGTTAGVTNLSAGSNSVLVTDANGCTALATTNISSTGGPTVAISSQANVTCFGANTGTATINTSGGTAPYSYTWTPGNLSSASQTSLSAGIYTINVADVNQCAGAATLSISQPTSSLTAIISSTSATSCGINTGGATVTANGGTPGYTYSWTPSGGTTASVANLSTGSNTVTVIDNNGCSIMAIATIISTSGPTVSVLSQTNILCNNDATGSATINANGGLVPYTYSWAPSGGNSNSASGLTAGAYTVTVTDASQCASSINLIITEAPPISFTLSSSPALCGNVGGSATITATGGVAPLTILWADGSSNASIGNLIAGSYFVTITDANNCSESGNVVVELLSTQTINGTPCIIEIPNIITPNNDNANDFFKIKNLEYFPNTSVSIFNRWGTKLYENANYKNEWNADGISDGTYFYIISVSKDQQYKGYVTVFRTN